MKDYYSRKKGLIALSLSFVIYLVTFQRFEPFYGPGLDPSYIWAINYLVNFDYEALTGLIYPIGPLGFLKYSAAFENNLMYSLAFYSLVKITFLFFLFKLNITVKQHIDVLHFLVALCVGYFSGVDFSIIGSVVVLLLLYMSNPKKVFYFVLANVFAITGLFIKSSIGIGAYSSIFVFFLLGLIQEKFKLKNFIFPATILLSVFLIFGIFIFRGLFPFIEFLKGLMHLAGAYASGLAMFPNNNWWLLTGFILTIILFPILFKNRDDRFSFMLLLLPLFASWKHGMGREDIYHAQPLLAFLVVFWGIIFFNKKKVKPWFYVLPLVGILLYSFNLRNLPLYSPYPIKLVGFTNFTEAVLQYPQFDEKYKAISQNNIKVNKVDTVIRNLIGESDVEIYPWDLSFVPANKFNWKPRKTLELGASTSKWLSNKTAEYFVGENAPGFVIFHLIDDKWGGRFGTFDDRYLLNDDPSVIYNLLNYYSIQLREEGYLLFEKTEKSNIENVSKVSEQIVTWKEWVNVPPSGNVISRVKFTSQSTILGTLKSFLYKGEGFFIDYQLLNGKVITYRFLASNAENGLWINPLLFNPEDENFSGEVSMIRFRCTDEHMVKNEIKLEWEHIQLIKSTSVENLFGGVLNKNSKPFSEIYTHQLISNEDQKQLLAKKFSPTFQVLLDTVWSDQIKELKVETDLMYLFQEKETQKVMLVISLQNSPNDFWKSIPLNKKNNNEWNFAYLQQALTISKHSKGLLTVYVWNNGDTNILLDDYQVIIKAR